MTSTTIDKPNAQTTKQEDQSSCCGGAAPKGVDACCALDAEVKSSGGSGCGCGPKSTPSPTVKKSCC